MIKYENDFEMEYSDIVLQEEKIYQQYLIKGDYLHPNVQFEKVVERELDFIRDKIYNLPQAIFFVKLGKYKILGRKLRSVLSRENKINAAHCSQITPSMILGILKESKKEGKDIFVSYYPMTEEERVASFKLIAKNLANEIHFLYQERDYKTNQVQKTGKDGWSFNLNKLVYLGYGEEHIRKYTISRFKNELNKNIRVYDPACSTGQFLYTLKKRFPTITTIGGELSKEMIEYAKDYLDEYEWSNAKDSKLQEESVDVLFLRFLNDQVVSRYQARRILPNVLKKLKKGGLVVAFGHTPVLLTKKQFENFGLVVEECLAYDKGSEIIFQYYVMRKV